MTISTKKCYFVLLWLFLFSVDADLQSRGTPAQEQCKTSRCANHCSCNHVKPKNCHQILSNGCDDDGVYRIYPDGYRRGLEVHCDQTTNGGGWQVFQKRFNGTVDFRRNWVEYKYGFGNAAGEHWLGLVHIHNILTQDHSHPELRIELEDMDNNTYFANYGVFHLLDEISSYRIEVEHYHGDTGDFMHIYSKQPFSTTDKDNSRYHWPFEIGGTGWWYYPTRFTTAKGILNAQFLNTSGTFKEQWMTGTETDAYLRKTEMKFR